VKRTLVVWLLTSYAMTVLAQTGQTPKIVHITEKSAVHVPPQEVAAGLKKIYSNLGKSKIDLYIDYYGWGLAGPGSNGGYPIFIAMPFTPKSDSHVSQVQVAVQYQGGANQVNLSIYADSSGIPGTLLAGPVTVTNLPEVGTCCTLAVASFSPVPVTGGTQYWLVADTPATGTGSDFLGSWDMVVQGKIPPLGAYNRSGWFAAPALDEPAGEVLGTIP
jgi:hypothetical protein